MDIQLYLINNFPHIPIDNINFIMGMVEKEVLEYCNLQEIPKRLEGTILEMCIHKINTLNSVGVASEEGGNTSTTLNFEYPERIYKSLKGARKLAK